MRTLLLRDRQAKLAGPGPRLGERVAAGDLDRGAGAAGGRLEREARLDSGAVAVGVLDRVRREVRGHPMAPASRARCINIIYTYIYIYMCVWV